MKTLKRQTKNEVEYKRVQDDEADRLVSIQSNGWSFCPKSEWKENVRDFGKEKSESKSETSKPSKKSQRKEKAKA